MDYVVGDRDPHRTKRRSVFRAQQMCDCLTFRAQQKHANWRVLNSTMSAHGFSSEHSTNRSILYEPREFLGLQNDSDLSKLSQTGL